MNEITNKPSKAEQWATHIERWKESKLSQPEYCKQAGIGYAAFVYWRGKQSSKAEAKFVPVKLAAKSTANHEAPKSIQIKLVTGHVVYIPANLPVNDIVALISALGSSHA